MKPKQDKKEIIQNDKGGLKSNESPEDCIFLIKAYGTVDSNIYEDLYSKWFFKNKKE